jgi:hypothetical protein
VRRPDVMAAISAAYLPDFDFLTTFTVLPVVMTCAADALTPSFVLPMFELRPKWTAGSENV